MRGRAHAPPNLSKLQLDGVNLRLLKTASAIADEIDLDRVAPLLYDEINGFSLNDVSLN